MRSVLVTGATGFVGKVLVENLIVSGFSVVAAVRESSASGLVPDVVRKVHFDLSQPELLTAASLSGVECIVHLAARVHVMRQTPADAASFQALNVRATEILARRAAEAGVRRFIFLSSIKVNGEQTLAQPFTSTDPPAPVDAYGVSKHQAELALWKVASDTGLEVVIVRPPLVYGPNVGANFLRLMSLVQRGLPLPLGAVNNRRSLISVWNLVNMLQLVLTHPNAKGTWLVSDNDDVSTTKLLQLIAQSMHRHVRLWPVPVPLLRAGAFALGRYSEITRLIDSLQVEVTPVQSSLGWVPPLSLDHGIQRTVEFYMRAHSAHA